MELTKMIEESLAQVKTMFNADTVIGKPVTVPDGTTIIPVSTVSFGFSGGGYEGEKKNLGGGTGGGGKITPVAFLVIQDGEVKILPVEGSGSDPLGAVLDSLPGLIKKAQDFIGSRKKKGDDLPQDE